MNNMCTINWAAVKMHVLLTMNGWRLACMNPTYYSGPLVLLGGAIIAYAMGIYIWWSIPLMIAAAIAWALIFLRASVYLKHSVYVMRYFPQSWLFMVSLGWIVYSYVMRYGMHAQYMMMWFVVDLFFIFKIIGLLFFLDARTMPLFYTNQVRGPLHLGGRLVMGAMASARMVFLHIPFIWWWLIHIPLLLLNWYGLTTMFIGFSILFYTMLLSSIVTLYLQHAYGIFEYIYTIK
jgi:hypothetical protein